MVMRSKTTAAEGRKGVRDEKLIVCPPARSDTYAQISCDLSIHSFRVPMVAFIRSVLVVFLVICSFLHLSEVSAQSGIEGKRGLGGRGGRGGPAAAVASKVKYYFSKDYLLICIQAL